MSIVTLGIVVPKVIFSLRHKLPAQRSGGRRISSYYFLLQCLRPSIATR